MNWVESGTPEIVHYERSLIDEANIFHFTEVVSTVPRCQSKFFFVEQWSASLKLWVAYDGPNLSLDSVERKVMVQTTHEQEELLGETLKLRVSIASVPDLSDAKFPTSLYLSFTIVDPCL